jgi:hypothetical protein
VNIPLIIGIPLFVEFGMPAMEKKDVSIIYVVLHMTDFFLCFNSLIIYTMISKLVTTIKYLPDEHKITIKQCKDWMLKEKTTTYDLKDIIKCKKQVLNPFVGYRSV